MRECAELSELTTAFNTLSVKLRSHLDHLEEEVAERTSELVQANRQLFRELQERRRTEQEKDRLIADLNEALAKVKTLSGFLPICASCKKIRDDSGYWNQIEMYIRDHSDADFSHGICPDCAEKLYPDMQVYGAGRDPSEGSAS